MAVALDRVAPEDRATLNIQALRRTPERELERFLRAIFFIVLFNWQTLRHVLTGNCSYLNSAHSETVPKS